MDGKKEVGKVPEGSGGNFTPDPAGWIASVSCNVDTKRSWYLTFDPGGMSTMNLKILYQDSESNKAPRGEPKKLQRQSYKRLKRPNHMISK